MSLMYLIGEIILIQVVKYYKLVAVENYIQVMYNLVLMYREGEGVKQDIGKVIDLMERVVEQGLVQVRQGKFKGLDRVFQIIFIVFIMVLL